MNAAKLEQETEELTRIFFKKILDNSDILDKKVSADIGRTIQRARQDLKLTQKDLAVV